ncbi:MAG: npdA [Ilumatobacteraceae bacterium]|jgi:NAD-dependent deacetylase|nr:npdA [Ilumatobacteraceae bacterium]
MDDVELEDANEWLRGAARVTVLTGAGISTDSGIPDFRGPNGVWTKNPAMEKASTLQHYLADADVRRAAWQNRLHSPAWDARPNAGHLAIVELERQGKLVAVVTQNIDELHQRAGNSPDKVIEVHGTMRWARCWECGDRRSMDDLLVRVRAGDDDPACAICGGIVKSDTISFGQSLVPEVIDAALTAAESCDVLIAAGSTLSVFPAANLVPRAKSAGARVVIVNAEPTGMDRYADAVLLGELSVLLPALVATGADRVARSD